MTEILVFCDKDQVAFELLSKCRTLKNDLGAKVSALVLGAGAADRSKEYSAYGAEKIYTSNQGAFSNFQSDIYSQAIAQIPADVILIGSTKLGKELAPRVAQKLGAGCLTDAINVEVKGGELQVSRYALGGNTVSCESIQTAKKVVAVMPRTFALSERTSGQGEIVSIDFQLKDSKLKIVEKRDKKGETVNLEDAQTLVCAGRGLNKKEDLSLIENLAKALKAEIGCTRPLSHELRWLPEAREVGLSGKKCKPALCFSIGISGQIQHTVGIRDSEIIVAVNKDKNAPIYKMADYGIVGDLYAVIPLIIQNLGK